MDFLGGVAVGERNSAAAAGPALRRASLAAEAVRTSSSAGRGLGGEQRRAAVQSRRSGGVPVGAARRASEPSPWHAVRGVVGRTSPSASSPRTFLSPVNGVASVTSLASNGDEDEDDICCPLCLDILYRPVRTPCGHHFCAACSEATCTECPVCGMPLPSGVDSVSAVRGSPGTEAAAGSVPTSGTDSEEVRRSATEGRRVRFDLRVGNSRTSLRLDAELQRRIIARVGADRYYERELDTPEVERRLQKKAELNAKSAEQAAECLPGGFGTLAAAGGFGLASAGMLTTGAAGSAALLTGLGVTADVGVETLVVGAALGGASAFLAGIRIAAWIDGAHSSYKILPCSGGFCVDEDDDASEAGTISFLNLLDERIDVKLFGARRYTNRSGDSVGSGGVRPRNLPAPTTTLPRNLEVVEPEAEPSVDALDSRRSSTGDGQAERDTSLAGSILNHLPVELGGSESGPRLQGRTRNGWWALEAAGKRLLRKKIESKSELIMKVPADAPRHLLLVISSLDRLVNKQLCACQARRGQRFLLGEVDSASGRLVRKAQQPSPSQAAPDGLLADASPSGCGDDSVSSGLTVAAVDGIAPLWAPVQSGGNWIIDGLFKLSRKDDSSSVATDVADEDPDLEEPPGEAWVRQGWRDYFRDGAISTETMRPLTLQPATISQSIPCGGEGAAAALSSSTTNSIWQRRQGSWSAATLGAAVAPEEVRLRDGSSELRPLSRFWLVLRAESVNQVSWIINKREEHGVTSNAISPLSNTVADVVRRISAAAALVGNLPPTRLVSATTSSCLASALEWARALGIATIGLEPALGGGCLHMRTITQRLGDGPINVDLSYEPILRPSMAGEHANRLLTHSAQAQELVDHIMEGDFHDCALVVSPSLARSLVRLLTAEKRFRTPLAGSAIELAEGKNRLPSSRWGRVEHCEAPRAPSATNLRIPPATSVLPSSSEA